MHLEPLRTVSLAEKSLSDEEASLLLIGLENVSRIYVVGPRCLIRCCIMAQQIDDLASTTSVSPHDCKMCALKGSTN